MSIALGLALAALMGVTLGLLGGGGSILTVPVFVYILGYAPKPAIAMSLPVIGVTSLMAAAMHWRIGNVRVGTAVLFGPFAMAGAFAGARLAGFLSGAVQLLLLALAMLIAATSMLRGQTVAERPADEDARLARLALLGAVAFGVGVLTGVVGVGGGFLFVPSLVLLARMPMKQAVGTSLLVIAMNSAAGFAGYLGSVRIDWAFMTAFTAIAVVGAYGGTALGRAVPQATLRRAFGIFLLIIGGVVLYKNRSAFQHTTAPASRAHR
jgi:uncharacterized membrane protein YfcA